MGEPIKTFTSRTLHLSPCSLSPTHSSRQAFARMKVALVMLLVAVTAVYHTEGQEDRWNVALASDQCGASGLCANLAWFKKMVLAILSPMSRNAGTTTFVSLQTSGQDKRP